jgi:hypothetical protein
LFRAFGSEIRKHLSLFRLNHETMSENVSYLTGQVSCLFFVVHVALQWRGKPGACPGVPFKIRVLVELAAGRPFEGRDRPTPS